MQEIDVALISSTLSHFEHAISKALNRAFDDLTTPTGCRDRRIDWLCTAFVIPTVNFAPNTPARDFDLPGEFLDQKSC